MPYWDRQDLLDANLARMKILYPHYDLEILIINDGWQGKYVVKDTYPWRIRIYDMPDKLIAKNSCVPLNMGVELANGDIIVLTNPEVIQRQPILDGMEGELKKLGKRGYVAASVWDVEGSKWLCHTSHRTHITVPANAGLPLFSMMYKEFFQKVKFNECYRDGFAFEDNDFLWRLWEVEAKFKICDDLTVNHYATKTDWPSGSWERNKEIFRNKWLPIGDLKSE